MVERIKEIILKEGLTSGSFADLIGVQRSSMSHIINGRNNPSLDFIVKTIQSFPKINPEWLLNGVGTMYRSENPVQPVSTVRDRSIFDSVSEPVAAKPETIAIKPEPVVPKPEPVTPKPEQVAVKPEPVVKPIPVTEPKPIEKQIDPVQIHIRFVDKVMIFYSDHTYDEFSKTQKPEI